MVGLPDAAGKEIRGHVRAALENIGFNVQLKQKTVNLVPADQVWIVSKFLLPRPLAIFIEDAHTRAS
jgi:predicted ATPase with chaperone activity